MTLYTWIPLSAYRNLYYNQQGMSSELKVRRSKFDVDFLPRLSAVEVVARARRVAKAYGGLQFLISNRNQVG